MRYNVGRMKITLRLNLIILTAALLPIVVFITCISVLKLVYSYALAITIISAGLVAFFAVRVILKGMARPISKMSEAVKSFRAADYKLDEPLSKEGWPEAAVLVSSLNRLMLELSAYRSFQLNQVVEERAKAQALIETITDAILLVDDRGRLIHSNNLAFKILKINKEEQDTVLPGSVGEMAFRPIFKDILDSEKNYLRADVIIQEKDSSAMRDFRVISRQFHMAAFNRPGRVFVIRDVTMEKEIESARETFFHMITHDMRTPLTSIQGYTQLMGNNLASSEVREKCLHAITNSSKRLNGMIQDILNTIKLEKGEMVLHREKLDVTSLYGRVVELYKPLVSRKNINFSISLQEEKISVNVDSGLIDRVICNLLGNSLKFTPDEGSITLACRHEGENVVFSVTDTGSGISSEKQEEIFGKYSQQEEHKYMGFGLGLAICKMAVELHGGSIKVESEEGKGSSFIFTIPKESNHG